MHLPLSCSICKIYVGAIFNGNMRQNVITPRAGIPPDCDCLAETLALLHLRLFPQPFSNHATVCSGVGEGTSESHFKSEPTWVIARTDYHMLVSNQSIRVVSGEIYLRLKLYIVVKISFDIVTEHCCQVCLLSMIFCCSDCRLCADMVSGNQEIPRYAMWFDTPTGQCGIWKIFFTFDFYILP